MSTIAADVVERTPAERDAFDTILALLRERTGTDFCCYRHSTITRRVLNRMISVGASTFADYLALLRDNEAEATHLLQRVTIKVSRFYRNREVFDLLRHHVVPELARTRGGLPLLFWSAGCGYGEEPYTLAMLLEEVGVPGRVVATDIDRAALTAARSARYPDSALEELPADLRERYLHPAQGTHVITDRVRERVLFAHGDLTAFSGAEPRDVDLICCRNVLIYLAPDVQRRVLQSLIGNIRAGAYLALGEAEWPASVLSSRLEPLDRKSRIFRVPGTAGTGMHTLGGKW